MKDASVVIVAGGSGTRMGRPKQMLPVAGRPALERSIAAFAEVARVGEIIVVTAAENFIKLTLKFKNIKYAAPGKTRIESVKNGVALCGPKYKLIAIHDGARPLVSPEKTKECLQSAQKNKAAVLAVAVKDTIKLTKDGFVKKTLDRSVLWAAQTPQCYRADIIRAALKKYGGLKNATDESQLVEKLGVKVAIVPSEYENIKITTPEDLTIAEALCRKRAR